MIALSRFARLLDVMKVDVKSSVVKLLFARQALPRKHVEGKLLTILCAMLRDDDSNRAPTSARSRMNVRERAAKPGRAGIGLRLGLCNVTN